MNIFLDDIRCVPNDGQNWLLVKTESECKQALVQYSGTVETLSLDHDLGENDTVDSKRDPGCGYGIATWLEDCAHNGILGLVPVHLLCHSANPEGRKRILQAFESIEKIRGKKP